MLDPDRPDTVRVTVAEAAHSANRALRRIGYPADEAAIITDQLIDNALCGYRFASLPRILAIAEDEKTSRPRTPIRIVRETPVSALVDGGNKVGYIAAYRGAEIAIAEGQSQRHRHRRYPQQLLQRPQRLLRGANRPRRSGGDPHRQREAARPAAGRTSTALGTNPFSIGFPSANGPVIYDIGTASLMWGEVLLMARLGEPSAARHRLRP